MTGVFVAFEGGEGSGKSTQARLLADRIGAVLTREPGGTALGARLRALLLDPDVGAVDPRAEALLMVADRAQHVAEVIAPALAAGRSVVSDRYASSTLAYQGHGRGLALGELASLTGWAAGGLEPDLTVLLDLPRDVARTRLNATPDRMEGAGDAFHQRVLDGYRSLAAAHPERWLVVDGREAVEAVAATVASGVTDRLGDRLPSGP